LIKNERQHRITKAHAERFRATLNELAATPRPKHVHPKLWEAQKAGLKSQLQDLEAELQEYETLKSGGKSGGPKILEMDSLDGLPKILIQARIAAGLTQEDLAARLGVKAQQIQRYEASDYQTASFARLREIARLLGLRVRESVGLIQN
jgi:ribosome-binding protein aMBF1 (putative translation factor)